MRTFLLACTLVAVACSQPASKPAPAAIEKAPGISTELQLAYYKAHSHALEVRAALDATPQAKAMAEASQAEQAIVSKLVAACGEKHDVSLDAKRELKCVPKAGEKPPDGPKP